jgi:hypothetical protein
LCALGALVATALLAACAQVPGGEAGAATTSAAGAASAGHAGANPGSARTPGTAASGAAAAPAAGQPPAFATVIKDAQRIEGGTFPVWRKDEKVWIELAEKDFGVPLFFSPKIASGIGEGPLLGGLMSSRSAAFGRPQLVEFRRVYQQIQLVARNTRYVARDGTPAARAVRSAFSPSLIGSAPLASQPHPERKTVLVEASNLLAGDLLGLGILLQRAYRQGYALDGRHSALLNIRAKSDALVFEFQNHYATSGINTPQPAAGGAGPQPSLPDTLPDVRSLFVTLHYSLSRLPEQPMAPRLADARIGHFISLVGDFSDDLERSARRHYINRWRLEKKDPAAALSEPVRPITYWIDADVPEKYRASISAGILEWNLAFEKIGFKNAIVVQQQPDKADFDTLDVGVASVRWMTNAQASFGAIGPSHVDPRSGEILDADVAIESLSSRGLRAARAQILPPRNPAASWARLMQSTDLAAELRADAQAAAAVARPGTGADVADAPAWPRADACEHADHAAEELSYALDVLSARGDLDPASPEVEAFVQAYMKDVTMHEVGHTLGLRHNFRASRVYDERALADPEFTRSHALSGSVMEYLPVNLPRPGEKTPAPFQTTLGPYDYWAIEYAYKPMAPEREAAELARIAARSGETELAYATDEDAFLGLDPEALQFDLGSDPVAYAARRLVIAQDLLRRVESRKLDEGDDYPGLRRTVSYALRDVARASGVLARQIGGVRTLRDRANTRRDPLEPVPASRQRAALDALASGLLAPNGLALSSALQRRLAPDFLERGDAIEDGDAPVSTDYAPAQVLLDMQKALIGQLLSDGVASRLLDSEGKAPGADGSLRLSELYGRVQRELWSELGAPQRGDIAPLRRELQRDHVGRLAAALLNPARLSRADARSLVRAQAVELQTRLAGVARRNDLGEETRAHLRDCADTLAEALAARLTRAAP